MKQLQSRVIIQVARLKADPNDKFVVANYELSNGLTRGLKTVCNFKIVQQKQLREQGTCSHLQ